ncbi:Cytochrome P450 9e2 [Eumeta japonica]|uniref:unspecific monooxygenase n=1 Tax=Eumeta variegata TaxID=151549 RepID=A0A4C1YM95_EUMVA|nr:Cytochrome P450 9e2 [Eumeta japonica]
MSAVILVRDPEIIKSITVKDFDHFTDHREYFSEDVDPLYGGSLLMMTGEKWRRMRAALSPAFTGSRVRKMVPFIDAISTNIVGYLHKQIKTEDNISDEIDVEDLMTRYSNDVIASTAFGLEVNSLVDKSNEFYVTGQKLSSFTFWDYVNMMIVSYFPNVAKDSTFVIASTLKTELKQNDNAGFATAEECELKTDENSKEWSLDELAAQAFIFFSAGFDSTATVLIMTVHELALNEIIQNKLYEEVKAISDRNESLTYDIVPQLQYLDMVISETLRKWSPSLVMDRVCVKPYELPPPRPGAEPYRVEIGETVYNPINCIHMDEKYFSNPYLYDPERFSEGNKKNIQPFTFMPFGVGPRNCFASRFALMELKVLLYHLVLNFEILKCNKTGDPIRLKGGDMNIRAVGGTWIKIRRRNIDISVLKSELRLETRSKPRVGSERLESGLKMNQDIEVKSDMRSEAIEK